MTSVCLSNTSRRPCTRFPNVTTIHGRPCLQPTAVLRDGESFGVYLLVRIRCLYRCELTGCDVRTPYREPRATRKQRRLYRSSWFQGPKLPAHYHEKGDPRDSPIYEKSLDPLCHRLLSLWCRAYPLPASQPPTDMATGGESSWTGRDCSLSSRCKRVYRCGLSSRWGGNHGACAEIDKTHSRMDYIVGSCLRRAHIPCNSDSPTYEFGME